MPTKRNQQIHAMEVTRSNKGGVFTRDYSNMMVKAQRNNLEIHKTETRKMEKRAHHHQLKQQTPLRGKEQEGYVKPFGSSSFKVKLQSSKNHILTIEGYVVLKQHPEREIHNNPD